MEKNNKVDQLWEIIQLLEGGNNPVVKVDYFDEVRKSSACLIAVAEKIDERYLYFNLSLLDENAGTRKLELSWIWHIAEMKPWALVRIINCIVYEESHFNPIPMLADCPPSGLKGRKYRY